MQRSKLPAAGLLALLLSVQAAWADDAPVNPATANTPPAPTVPANGREQAQAAKASGMEVTWDKDPYYSDIDLNIPLTDTPIPTIKSDSEAVIYRDLIEGSFVPRYMLLEGSVYPMPILGTFIHSHSPWLYQQGEISRTGVNLIESATAGFQEPWAMSAFFGNIANLERPGDDQQKNNNLGYTGYLFSAGAQHIKDNVSGFRGGDRTAAGTGTRALQATAEAPAAETHQAAARAASGALPSGTGPRLPLGRSVLRQTTQRDEE